LKKFILLTLQDMCFQDIMSFSTRKVSSDNHEQIMSWETLKDLEIHSWERQFSHWQTASYDIDIL
jgi:hypothetical protein